MLDGDGRFHRMAEVDEVGVIAISGPNVFKGYLDPRHNAGVFIDIDGERCRLNTGDLGRRDANGYFWLTGRKKELIIRGGHGIDARTIEEALASHPGVALAAAIGSPDAYAGEMPVAYVQLEPGATVTEQELLEHAAMTIPERAAIPNGSRSPRRCQRRPWGNCSSRRSTIARSRKPSAPRRTASGRRSRPSQSIAIPK